MLNLYAVAVWHASAPRDSEMIEVAPIPPVVLSTLRAKAFPVAALQPNGSTVEAHAATLGAPYVEPADRRARIRAPHGRPERVGGFL